MERAAPPIRTTLGEHAWISKGARIAILASFLRLMARVPAVDVSLLLCQEVHLTR